MSRRKRLNLFDKIFLGFIGILLVVGLITSLVVSVQSARQEQIDAAYHEKMASVLDSVTASQVTGDKAVSYVFDGEDATTGTYSTHYVPEELRTENPDEVRYVLTCIEDSSIVGTYSNGGGVGRQHWCSVEIKDLKTGESLGVETFWGGDPPSRVTSGGVHYGSHPDRDEIYQWVMTSFAKPEVPAETVTEPVQTDEIYTETQTTATEKADENEAQTSSEPVLQKAQELLAGDIGFAPRELEFWLQEYEGFTAEEAAYAVENCGADWFEQAVKAGAFAIEQYDHIVNRQELLWHLHQCGFTAEQAAYSADQNGF